MILNQRIDGTITRADGLKVSFAITPDGTQQWHVQPSELGATQPLVEAMTDAVRATDFFNEPPMVEDAPVVSHTDAQELHQCIGQVMAQDGDWRVALERALELASVIVSDTDPENQPG